MRKSPENVCGVLNEKCAPHRLGRLNSCSQLVALFGEEVHPWGGHLEFTALPYSWVALWVWFVLLKSELSALCSCLHACYSPLCFPVWRTPTPRNRKPKWTASYAVTFSHGILSQQEKSHWYSVSEEMGHRQTRRNTPRDSTCVP